MGSRSIVFLPNTFHPRIALSFGVCRRKGRVGYSTFNQLPTYAAKIRTEKGDVLRVYEWDRWNKTTWQVDLALEGDMLVAGVTIRNPMNVRRVLCPHWVLCPIGYFAPFGLYSIIASMRVMAPPPPHHSPPFLLGLL